MRTDEGLKFGRFQLQRRQRRLLMDGALLEVGGPAIDILEALIDAGGALVSKEELLDRAWPGMVVEEHNLTAQIHALRKALGYNRDLIRTVSRHGYTFTGKVGINTMPAQVIAAVHASATNIPTQVDALIGRDHEVQEVLGLQMQRRLLTLTGPGGIGKTRLALEVARKLLPFFSDGVWLAELATLSDAALVPANLASVLRLQAGAPARSIEAIASALTGKNLLLVLDNCEHLVAEAARVVEALLHGSSSVQILTTSREPLRAEGEMVYRVLPLAIPAPGLSAAEEILCYGAVQFFIARANAAGMRSETGAVQLATIAAICRRLDGIPLAIELAAARVASLGLNTVLARLDDRFALLTSGRRTALARQQTLHATLDWSHNLLDRSERVLLRRLAVFSGAFPLEAASVVITDSERAPIDIVNGISSLVAKSLISSEADTAGISYRLLETTRAYALDKLGESGEREPLARRHAEYYLDLFHQAEREWDSRPTADWLREYSGKIDNLRAALDWASSPSGDSALAAALTAAAVPLWFEMWLLEECHARAEHALTVFEDGQKRDDRVRMRLYAAVAFSQAYTARWTRDTYVAWTNALEAAQTLDDAEYQLRALWGIWGTLVNRGEFSQGLVIAKRFSSLAETRSDGGDQLVGDRLTGAALHFLGDQGRAREHIERMLAGYVTPKHRSPAVRFQSDQRVTAQMYLARILWLQGCPEQAARVAEADVEDARATNHVLSLCNALAGAACPIALLTGDLAAAERYATILLDRTAREALEIWRAHGLCFEGEVLRRRGDVATGLLRLRAGTNRLIRAGFNQYLPALLGVLAEGLAAGGEVSEASAVTDAAITRSERSHGHWCLPELLRVKGEIVLRTDATNGPAAAQKHFLASLDLAQMQGALSWKLRTATSMARLSRDQGRVADAYELLKDVQACFGEGHGTADFANARRLLQELAAGRRRNRHD